jgi:hypothetical protein
VQSLGSGKELLSQLLGSGSSVDKDASLAVALLEDPSTFQSSKRTLVVDAAAVPVDAWNDPQSLSLGWSDPDSILLVQSPQDAVQNFCDRLMDDLGMVLIREELDKSLIVLRRKVGWSLTYVADMFALHREAIGVRANPGGTAAVKLRLRHQVDAGVHAYFLEKLRADFAALGRQGQAEVDALRRESERRAN